MKIFQRNYSDVKSTFQSLPLTL